MHRPTFHEINLVYAELLSGRSTCRRLKVGAVITSSDFRQVYGIGYNGGAAGDINDCDRHGEEAVGNCGCMHAELNAIINCSAPRPFEKVAFCTHLPCVACSKALINLGGVREVYYRNDYRLKDSLIWFQRAGIVVGHYNEGTVGIDEARHRSRTALHEYLESKTP